MVDTKLLCAFLLVLFAFCIQDTEASDWCYNYYSSGYYSHHYSYKYCTYGCCGEYKRQYCCSSSWGLIVGCVIAGIIFVAIVVALVCCCIKKQSHAGRVVHPTGTRPAANVTVVHAGTSYPGPAQPMGPMGPMQPPPYKQFNNPPPPAYNYSDPAYPPGAAAYPPPASAAFPPPASAAFPPPPSAPANTQPPPPGFNVNGPNQ